MERLSIFVAPFFFRLILAFYIDRARIPVGFLAAHIVAAFQNENALSGRCECVHKRSAPRAGSNDDHVVVLAGVHAVSLAFTNLNLSVPPRLNFFSIPCTGNEKCTAGCSRDETWRSTLTARSGRERRALPPSASRAAGLGNRCPAGGTYRAGTAKPKAAGASSPIPRQARTKDSRHA